jgi:putative MATE family efflux protein
MKLKLSYNQILKLSAPIMIGSAAQNIVALTDSIFLYHLNEVDFAAIGFVGIFFLIISAIAYGFSRGGQILVARKSGALAYSDASKSFYAMLYFHLALAIGFFIFIKWFSGGFFSWFIDSEPILEKSIAYLEYRAYGVFPSFVGLALIGFYTGIARARIIMYDTLVLIVVNIFLNYSLIFGKFGFPEMGIAGAGLASTLAEVVALIVFSAYMFFDSGLRRFRMFRFYKLDLPVLRQNIKIGSPVVIQAVVGLGSWFFLFSVIENFGEHALAVSNLVRVVYLIVSVPCWGYSVGINTLASNLIGQGKSDLVIPAILKTVKICVFSTVVIALPILLFPKDILYPLLGSEDMSLFTDAQPIFYVLFIILFLFSIGSILYNGMVGTGAIRSSLIIQISCSLAYVILVYAGVNFIHVNLVEAWAIEILYWIPMIFFIWKYLVKETWKDLSV